MYARWLLFAPISLAGNILTILLSPVLAAVVAIGRLENLPGPLVLFQTHDNNVYGTGNDGSPQTISKRWTRAMYWLCRNPSYYFDAHVLGFSGEGLVFERGGREVIFDTGKSAKRFDVMCAANGKRYWSYRRDFPLGRGRYVKMWLGWQTATQAGWHILKFDINPMKRADV